MSLAGTRSSQGDEYQLRVALNWLVRLLKDNSIRCIQVESLGVPGNDYVVTVDDVVVLYQDGRACFIQAKKNQPKHRYWSLSDNVLRDELRKARDQLETKENSEVHFYSRSPFGELKALAEGCRNYPDFPAFARDAANTLSTSLKQLAAILQRSEPETYAIARRFGFGPTNEFEDWDRQNRADLDLILAQADVAIPVLERYLGSHQANLRDSRHTITRADVLAELAKYGLEPTPKRSEAEILEAFTMASRIGRNWLRTVAGQQIPRAELSRLVELIDQGSRTILLTDRPGSGKTCLLLDLVDHIEQRTSWGLLFIKGDQFADAKTEADLVQRGLPDEIVGQCARLANFRQVVVVIDSLDVLSLSRRHGALKVFLGLMDRLERVGGATVVTACRDFDLQYDPLLRGRQWEHTVQLEPLDFESVVEPFLRNWGIHPASLSAELRALLQLPQNLRLFEKLARVHAPPHLMSEYELYECFLDEVVAKDPQLGDKALGSLQHMAERLMEQRAQTYSKAAFETDDTVVQRLISQEVLFELSPGILVFSHMTLAHSLIVRSALAHNRTLAEFILEHPPLPFIRPAVRAFFFSLRAHQPDVFRKQLWAALSHHEVAYHLKRLLSESLAEVTPVEEDWPLLRRLFRSSPDLFRRLLWRTEGDTWFHMLTQHWLPEVKTAESRESWLLQFIGHLRVWMNRQPLKVVGLWREAIDFEWANKQSLIGEISIQLHKFKCWDTEGVRNLLSPLVAEAGGEYRFVGTPLSCWVEATNTGDDLLWRYIVRNVSPEDVGRLDLGQKLQCNPHDFHNEVFLAERLRRSDELLTLALDDLERWSPANGLESKSNHLRSELLHDTSWGRWHSGGDMHPVNSLTFLLDGLEGALKDRSRQDDVWWRANEPRLRISWEEGIRYLVIQAYKENISANITGIEMQLQDPMLFRYGNLDHELGELMRAAYPYISEPAQDANQAMILSLYADEVWDDDGVPEWVYRTIYGFLICIPVVFRTPEAQALINTYWGRFGYALPSPRIYSSGGSVGPPLSSEDLLGLSDGAIFGLLGHYDAYNDWEEVPGSGLVGGRNQVQRVLREACSRHPERLLALFSHLMEADMYHGYTHAIIDGLAEHLRYRFGNLRSPDGWEPVVPVPDGDMVASALLDLLERYPVIWECEGTIGHALDACCCILDDAESAERLTFLLFATLRAKDPDPEEVVDDAKNLPHDAINSARGVAAKSAMILCNNLLERDHPLPELLPPLLRHFARDAVGGVRVSILQGLPYLTHKRPDLGWQLFADVFREPQTHLWVHAERCLYYQYRDHFERVRPYLDRLLQEDMEGAGDTWGRISTLASLAGHISKEELFDSLTKANARAWKGAAQVFSANLDRHEDTETCNLGLLTILEQRLLSDEVIRTVETSFGKSGNHGLIRPEVASAWLNVVRGTGKDYEIYYFSEWLAWEARQDPLSALEKAEMLADILERQEGHHQMLLTDLVAAFTEILREADETDNAALIKRAIDLQDRLLKLDLHGMDALLDEAGRS